ncbi:MAG: 4-hydroxythreonine-4-phosphate dehydrogenase PdxA [Candidatus Margulisbacteria bacterium]|jgi:4-hydroxythreonine-4-phosphate dehydrogenase|nr:4-hydroxythreonine-4-phosphate dehydrogenase PdxA [Candidatus Margulisiibacteriota bacterium]
MPDRPIIGITMGDPAGIGPEICAKALASSTLAKFARCLVIGDRRWLPNRLEVVDLHNADPKKIKVGRVAKAAGRAAMEYLEKAVELAKAKKIDAIVTAPINKEAIRLAGYNFPGHTEFLAARTKTKRFAMMFVSDKLWLMLATTHLPLAQVSRQLDRKKLVSLIKLAHETLTRFRGRSARIGVAGLNPHAGEHGLFGREEEKIIKPAVDEARRFGIDVRGPISPDAIFNLANAGVFDLVVAMYHDQGLIPLKLLAFNRSVNVTVGLPFVRTSVDHGTGFDIAGKGMANPQSLIEAVKVAAHFARR